MSEFKKQSRTTSEIMNELHIIQKEAWDSLHKTGKSTQEQRDKNDQLIAKKWVPLEMIEVSIDVLLRGQPELSPQTLRWLKFWFGFDADTFKWEKSGCGIKLLVPAKDIEAKT